MSKIIENDNILKNTLRLAIPIAIQQLLTASLHLIDTAMVVSLGDVSAAAIGAAGRWFFLLNLFMFGLASGMMVIVSQFWGIKDKKTIHKAFGVGMMNAVGVSLIFSIVALIFPQALLRVFTDEQAIIIEGAKYLQIAALAFVPLSVSMLYAYLLRSTENVMTPLAISFFSMLLNTGLNYILIFGKFGFEPMGIRGAAIATVISSVTQIILYILISRAKKNITYSTIKELIPNDLNFVKRYYTTSLPVVANEVAWALGVMVYSMVLARQGSSNYAAFTIYTSIEQIAFTFFIGICSACAVIVGKMVGRGQLQLAYDTSKKYIYTVIVVSIIVGTALFNFSPFLVGLYNVETLQTANTAIKLLKIYSLAMPIYLIPYIVIVGVFRAGGDTKTGMLIDVFNVWFIGVPVTLIAGFVLKLDFIYIFALMFSEHVIKNVMCFIHFKRKKWLRQLTL